MSACPKRSGFAVIELLVVMAVIAGLTTFASIAAAGQLRKARDARRKADLSKIKIALYDYFFDQNCFPDSLPGCNAKLAVGERTYLTGFPCDPQGQPYAYQTDEAGCKQWFKALTNLENTKDPDIDRVGCRAGCGPDCRYNYGVASTNIAVSDGCAVYYACTPNGECAVFDDPAASQCPAVFKNDPACNNVCSNRDSRCHDNRGRTATGQLEEEPTPTPKPKKNSK